MMEVTDFFCIFMLQRLFKHTTSVYRVCYIPMSDILYVYMLQRGFLMLQMCSFVVVCVGAHVARVLFCMHESQTLMLWQMGIFCIQRIFLPHGHFFNVATNFG
jgi:hypothetical protein